MKKLAIITTHPIQYYAPVFKLLHDRAQIKVKVFYTWGTEAIEKFDPGFGKAISWDIPLLEGYPYEWVQNTAADKGSHHFKGIINPELRQQVTSWQPNAILVYGWAYNSHLKTMRYFKNKVPVYFRGDSTLLNESSILKRTFKSIFLKWVYKHTDHAFYVGSHNKTYFKKFGLKDKNLTFAPHAIDNARFKHSRRAEVTALKLSLNIKEHDILILYAGKFEPVKNVDTLLTAFIGMNKSKTHLLLVGNGVNESYLKDKAARSLLAANIHFLDFQNQSFMPVLYQAADLFCLPSNSETWGLSVNEAMVCGKAVLVSDKVGCAIDLVKERNNGMIFKSVDPTDIKRCLDQLTASKELLKQYGFHSSQIIKDWNFLNIALAIENKLAHEPKR